MLCGGSAHPVVLPCLLLQLEILLCGHAPGLIAAVNHMPPLLSGSCTSRLASHTLCCSRHQGLLLWLSRGQKKMQRQAIHVVEGSIALVWYRRGCRKWCSKAPPTMKSSSKNARLEGAHDFKTRCIPSDGSCIRQCKRTSSGPVLRLTQGIDLFELWMITAIDVKLCQDCCVNVEQQRRA